MAAGVWVSDFTRAQPRGKLWRRPSGSLRPETPGMAMALRPHGAKGASTGSWGRDSWTGTAVWAELGWGVGRSRPLSRGNRGPKAWALSLLPPARVQGSPKPCDSPLSTRRSPRPSRIIFAKWEPSFDTSSDQGRRVKGEIRAQHEAKPPTKQKTAWPRAPRHKWHGSNI